LYKRLIYIVLISFFILSGCTGNNAYKDEDVAAVVRGEKITVGYLRFLYPDDAMKEMIDGVVKAKLAEQEVKKMDIDISKQVKEIKDTYGKYPQDDSNDSETQSTRKFADLQAEKLGMDPKEYYQEYTKASAEMVAYINTYVSEVLGELESDEFGVEEYDHHANELLDEIVDRNKSKIDIKIK